MKNCGTCQFWRQVSGAYRVYGSGPFSDEYRDRPATGACLYPLPFFVGQYTAEDNGRECLTYAERTTSIQGAKP